MILSSGLNNKKIAHTIAVFLAGVGSRSRDFSRKRLGQGKQRKSKQKWYKFNLDVN